MTQLPKNGTSETELLAIMNKFTNERNKNYEQCLVDLYEKCGGPKLKGTSRNKRRQFERWMNKHQVKTLQINENKTDMSSKDTVYVYSKELSYVGVISIDFEAEDMEFTVSRQVIPKEQIVMDVRLKMLE